jgi:hypothetical protein
MAYKVCSYFKREADAICLPISLYVTLLRVGQYICNLSYFMCKCVVFLYLWVLLFLLLLLLLVLCLVESTSLYCMLWSKTT